MFLRIIYELFPEDYDVIVWIPRVLILSLESFQCIDLVPKFLMLLRAPTPSRTVFVFIFLLWVILIATMQVMSATRADTYTNELKNTKDRQSETTSESSMIWSLKTSHKVLES